MTSRLFLFFCFSHPFFLQKDAVTTLDYQRGKAEDGDEDEDDFGDIFKKAKKQKKAKGIEIRWTEVEL